MKRTKKLTSWILAFCVIFSMMSQITMNVQAAENTLNLRWPNDMSDFPEWVKYGTQEVRDGLIDALNTEYNNQIKSGFNMGNSMGLGVWSGQVTVQFNDGDHIGNPWGQQNRRWGKIVAPYEGMAFTVKQHMSKLSGSDGFIPMANQITWKNPRTNEEKIYQVFKDAERLCNTDGTDTTGWGYHPGSNASGNCVDAFRRAYAQSAWYNESMKEPYHLGCIQQDAKKEGNIVYQECLGNQSDGRSPEDDRGYEYDYGISYLVAENSAATEAYIITDEMFTAWTTTWKSNNEKFANSGVPLGNQYINAEGKVAQDFENFTLVLNDDEYRPTKLFSKAEISNFAIEDGETLQNGEDIIVFLPAGKYELNNLAATFELSEGASVDKTSGTTQDFSEGVTYTTTAQNGDKYTYTVTIVEIDENNVTLEQTNESANYINKLKLLNDPLTVGDMETVTYLEKEFWELSDVAKYLARDEYEPLADAKQTIENLSKEPTALKVSCVGDSITELSPNYVVPLADRFDSSMVEFHNFGKSGHCLCEASDWPYTKTDAYTNSKNLQPDIVTIMLGTNDSKARNWDERNCKNTFKNDLINMIDTYRNLESKPHVMILTSPYANGNMDTINDKVIRLINEIQKEVAEEKDCVLVDIHALTDGKPSTTRDGVHPSDEGTVIMANAIADAINTNYLGTDISKMTVNGQNLNTDVQYQQVTLEKGMPLPEVIVETPNNAGTVTTTHVATEKEPYYIFKVTSKLGGYEKQYMVEFVGPDLEADMIVKPQGTVTCEAENGIFTGNVEVEENDGASNGAHIENVGGPNDNTVSFLVQAEKAAEYTLRIYYAQEDTRSLKVIVNSNDVATLLCENTGDWSTVGATPATTTIQLNVGNNIIEIGGPGENAYAPNIDRIELVSGEVEDEDESAKQPNEEVKDPDEDESSKQPNEEVKDPDEDESSKKPNEEVKDPDEDESSKKPNEEVKDPDEDESAKQPNEEVKDPDEDESAKQPNEEVKDPDEDESAKKPNEEVKDPDEDESSKKPTEEVKDPDEDESSKKPAGEESTKGDEDTTDKPTAEDNNKQEQATTEKQTGAVTTTEQQTTTQQSGEVASKLKKGDTFTNGKLMYQVTEITETKATVKVVKLAKTVGINLTIPATVNVNGQTFLVTEIGSNAFKNNKKLKTVTIGKNVTTIGKEAFYNCKQLRTVKFKNSNLMKVGSKAFNKTAGNLKIKTGSKSKIKAYQKVLKKKIPAGAKIIK